MWQLKCWNTKHFWQRLDGILIYLLSQHGALSLTPFTIPSKCVYQTVWNMLRVFWYSFDDVNAQSIRVHVHNIVANYECYYLHLRSSWIHSDCCVVWLFETLINIRFNGVKFPINLNWDKAVTHIKFDCSIYALLHQLRFFCHFPQISFHFWRPSLSFIAKWVNNTKSFSKIDSIFPIFFTVSSFSLVNTEYSPIKFTTICSKMWHYFFSFHIFESSLKLFRCIN